MAASMIGGKRAGGEKTGREAEGEQGGAEHRNPPAIQETRL